MKQDPNFQRNRRSRNIALGLALACFVLIMMGITMVRYKMHP